MTDIARRSLLLSGLGLGALGVLSACGGSDSSSSSTPAASGSAGAGTITIWVDSDRAPVLKSVAAQFKKDVGVTVNLVVKDNSKIVPDFITQVPTGKGPDAIICAHDRLGTLVKNGVVSPLELGDTTDQYQDIAIKAFTYQDKIYGVPYSTENLALIRNTKLAPSAVTSWDAMIAAGRKSGAKYPVLVGMDSVQAASPYNLYPFQASFNAPVFKIDADGAYDGTTLGMGGAAGASFATWLAAQQKAKTLNINISNDIAKTSFVSGQSPFFISGPWNLADIKAKKIPYAIEAIPAAGPQAATPFVGVQGFAMSSKSKNTVATQKFIVEYIGNADIQYKLFEVGQRPPANKEAFEKAKSDKDVAAYGAVGAKGVPMPAVPAMDSVWTDWGNAQAAILSGKSADPAAAWQKMVTGLQAKIK
ncbi:maltose ABC transporter substrate-binding protein [Acidipropionibacterium jensenii]|uniref:Maltose ABC transporter substrate-binding protein n=1 Tax=Acidipropionibacterium jensenii TaxID=1749 RepID=A0A3Q9UKB3_9ACTN|nr:maltose ABC transporter substrate-binding protein [Acidipropionibacterium jensenii]